MELDRELAKLAIHQDAGGAVETDHMVDILRRLFPQHSKQHITEHPIHEMSLLKGVAAPSGVRRAPGLMVETSSVETGQLRRTPPAHH